MSPKFRLHKTSVVEQPAFLCPTPSCPAPKKGSTLELWLQLLPLGLRQEYFLPTVASWAPWLGQGRVGGAAASWYLFPHPEP